jgi:hypothetical protein
MKKAKVIVKKRPPATDSTELRRWCIENAIRWPVDGGYGQGLSQHMPRSDVDVIGRAKKLLDWVTTP